MILFNHVKTIGWKDAIRGMRNPMNSWDKSDTDYSYWKTRFVDNLEEVGPIGPNDLKLMRTLAKAGSDHRKFMRMIIVYMDITAPLYWWKEFDTYKVGTVANSCSTMHKIADKEFTLDDFSHDYLQLDSVDVLKRVIKHLNNAREAYLIDKDKVIWWQMIQLLPSSYNQKRTVMLNYEVLANMYKSRKNHKLDEWRNFCEFMHCLPFSELVTNETPKYESIKDIIDNSLEE